MAFETMILTSGGLRSMVGTALVVSEQTPNKIALLNIMDERPTASIRRDQVHEQAAYFGIEEVQHLDLIVPGALKYGPMLMAALSMAIEIGAERLCWPANSGGDFAAISVVTEQTILLRHLAQTEARNPPIIDTPLIEMSDRQVIELGGTLNAPWEMSWSCEMYGAKPCLACGGCRRRHAAFESAGVVDPIDQTASVVR